MSGPLLGKDHLLFDSRKRPPPARTQSQNLRILGGRLWELYSKSFQNKLPDQRLARVLVTSLTTVAVVVVVVVVVVAAAVVGSQPVEVAVEAVTVVSVAQFVVVAVVIGARIHGSITGTQHPAQLKSSLILQTLLRKTWYKNIRICNRRLVSSVGRTPVC